MIRLRNSFWCAVGLTGLLGSVHAAPPVAGPDAAAIRAQTTSWAKAYNAGDVAGVVAQYADDAVLLPPNARIAGGKAAILAFFTKDIADSKAAGVVFTVDPKTDVGVSGNMGWESGTYVATIKGAVVEKGKFLSVSRKKDGKWQYIRDTWNADSPPPPPAMTLSPPAAPKK